MGSTVIDMSQYTDFELQTLIDLLVIYTRECNRILSSSIFRVDEFTQCKQKLAEIHAAFKEKSEKEGRTMENILPNFLDNLTRVKISK